MLHRDSVGGTFLVAAVLCIVCSVAVSATAVFLKPTQDAEIKLDQQKNILAAADALPKDEEGKFKQVSAAEVTELYKQVETIVIDLDTGERVDDRKEDPITLENLEKKQKMEEIPTDAPPAEKLGEIKEREEYSQVYILKKDGKISAIVLPFYGKGLWSTMKGYLALEGDAKTIKGLTYYSHGETPGLGGEVDNQLWKAQWPGTTAVDDDGTVLVHVTKAGQTAGIDTNIDGLSGATITTKGVDTMVRYWLGPGGFGPFLAKVRKGDFNG
ncbi:Na(+)-translocating NADH-quinone reductase subunit C [Blastopirellula sp. JC732]|uniref:Na(+)-translocating NADH-quinone reductase subunit C n=1 Tax=Blastopirellula sediminis TaxID=2894196 RepID=A0A9X1MPT2_9BACT|nr:Na(+)-translocating NADH-quinone reductase subunit C [Blastopirellula sediminis]MCC9605512.1 Na(+)-translocating NADH-quinone reductase subunit C [Blastopirellula sediminis]MCC9631188.1 Na(+)-translocating NADH-quinone reductase subunit C [Blastopirellula sediminis]